MKLFLGLDLARPRVLVLGLALGSTTLEGATFPCTTLLEKHVVGLGCRVPTGSMKAS